MLGEEQGNRVLVNQWRGCQAVIAAARGEIRAAREVLALAEGELSSDAPGFGAEMVAYAASVIAEADGDPAAAGVLDHAGSCQDAAAVLITAGQADEAKRLLIEPLERYEGAGAHAWAAQVSAQLLRLGVRRGARGPQRRPAHGWESLTDTERAVSQLVVEGLINRNVARRLHISPHTVSTHLRHVLEKLSVSNRAALAAAVAQSAAPSP